MKKILILGLCLFVFYGCGKKEYKAQLSRAVETAWDIDRSCWVQLEVAKQYLDMNYNASLDDSVIGEAFADTYSRVKAMVDSLSMDVETLNKEKPTDPAVKDISLINKKCHELASQLENKDLLGLDTLVDFVKVKIENMRETYDIPNPNIKQEKK